MCDRSVVNGSDGVWLRDLGARAPRSGYFEEVDLPETGALIGGLIRYLKDSRPHEDVIVRLIAASAAVPTTSPGQYTQMEALRSGRTHLRAISRDWQDELGVCTLFGKTLTALSVQSARSYQSWSEALAEDNELCHLLPGWAGPTHFRLRIRSSSTAHEMAQQLMLGGWISAVASTLRRRDTSTASGYGALRTISEAIRACTSTGDLTTLKAFTTPTWRTNSREVLDDPWLLLSKGHDLHMPELLSEPAVRAKFASPGEGIGTLLVSDVHGLYSGAPPGFLGPRPWPGIGELFRGLLSSARLNIANPHELMSTGIRIRLHVARRLRHTLSLIAGTPGVVSCSFLRGDGGTFLLNPPQQWSPELSARLVTYGDALPFGVGATRIRDGESVSHALARAECAVAFTKLAPPDAREHAYVHFDQERSSELEGSIDAALDELHQSPEAQLSKRVRGLAPYVDLIH